MTSLKYLVLFDIDGTLLHPDGAGRASLALALEQVYGTAGDAHAFSLAGSLDRNTVHVLMAGAGVAEETIWERFEELGRVMELHLHERIQARLHRVQPCPGAHTLINALHQRDDLILGLITGNFEGTARIKLAAAGFDPSVFRVGAFGHEADTRDELPRLAVERAAALTGHTFSGKQVVIIGDTPSDVTCGRSIGAMSIAVLTGWSSREELQIAGPDYLFDDLADNDAILFAIFAPEQ
jgi:phosphoglycolate phosphatase-like HAD superfamily hydrolase